MAAQVPLAPTNPKELLMRAATVGHQNWENQMPREVGMG